MPEKDPEQFSAEDVEHIARAERNGALEAVEVLGIDAAKKYFESLDAKRSGDDPPPIK